MKTFAGSPHCDDDYMTNEFVCYVITMTDSLSRRIRELQQHVKDASAFSMETFWPEDLKVYDGVPVLPEDAVLIDRSNMTFTGVYAENEGSEDAARSLQCLVVSADEFWFTWRERHGEGGECRTDEIPIEGAVCTP